MNPHKSAIFAFQFVKPILQTTTHCTPQTIMEYTIHGFRNSVLVCEMNDCIIRKNFEHFNFFPSSDATDWITMNRLDENKPLQNDFINVFSTAFTYSNFMISIILFLKNNSTNICCKINNIGMNLWMVYICNMNSSGKYNTKRWEVGECTLHCWPKSSEICDCSRLFYEF